MGKQKFWTIEVNNICAWKQTGTVIIKKGHQSKVRQEIDLNLTKKELQDKFEEVCHEKEIAVAEQDFEKAADLCEFGDRIKKRIEGCHEL